MKCEGCKGTGYLSTTEDCFNCLKQMKDNSICEDCYKDPFGLTKCSCSKCLKQMKGVEK